MSDKAEVIKGIAARLKDVERKEVLGASPRMLKQKAIDLAGLQEKYPDKHFRRVNARDPGKVQSRKAQGYTVTDEKVAEEAGVSARLGQEDVVMETSADRAEELRRANEAEQKIRLSAHKAEFDQTVEAVARELRDKHGLDVDVERLANSG